MKLVFPIGLHSRLYRIGGSSTIEAVSTWYSLKAMSSAGFIHRSGMPGIAKSIGWGKYFMHSGALKWLSSCGLVSELSNGWYISSSHRLFVIAGYSLKRKYYSGGMRFGSFSINTVDSSHHSNAKLLMAFFDVDARIRIRAEFWRKNIISRVIGRNRGSKSLEREVQSNVYVSINEVMRLLGVRSAGYCIKAIKDMKRCGWISVSRDYSVTAKFDGKRREGDEIMISSNIYNLLFGV